MADLSEANRQEWNRKAKDYESQEWQRTMMAQLTKGLQARLEWLGVQWSSANNQGEVRLLDYACGTGLVTRALIDHITTARGIDISESMVDVYNTRMRELSLTPQRASAVVGNLLDPENPSPPTTSSEDSGFDIAAVGMGFHHFEDTALCLRRLAERLRPGGVVLIIDLVHDHSRGRGHGHDHGHDHPHGEGRKDGEEDAFAAMRHTIKHDGFDEAGMRQLFEDAGLTDFGMQALEQPCIMVMGGKEMQRTAFYAKGRKAA